MFYKAEMRGRWNFWFKSQTPVSHDNRASPRWFWHTENHSTLAPKHLWHVRNVRYPQREWKGAALSLMIKGCRQHEWRPVWAPSVVPVCCHLQQPCVWGKQRQRGAVQWSDDTTNCIYRIFHHGDPRKHNMLPDVRGRAETTKPREFGNARKPVWIHFQLVGSNVHVHVHSPTEPHFSGWSVAMEMTATLPRWTLRSKTYVGYS